MVEHWRLAQTVLNSASCFKIDSKTSVDDVAPRLKDNCEYLRGISSTRNSGEARMHPRDVLIWLGWRFAFGIGGTLSLIVIFFRRWIPESPRWFNGSWSQRRGRTNLRRL